MGKEYPVDYVNVNDGVVVCGDMKIFFTDMGTGEGQLAYLLGLLNSDDSRMTIAIFDETNLMDPTLVKKILSRLQSLYDDGKLLLGMMAAPTEEKEVVFNE